MGVEMQKVFDVNNKEDMDLLWSILPDDVVIVVKDESGWAKNYCKFKRDDYSDKTAGTLFNIKWRYKTEITRPVNYEDMIGCVGYFWDEENESVKVIGILKSKINKEYCFESYDGSCWKHFTPIKKSELKFYEDK